MSWQAYVDTSLIATGNVDQAAIFNDEGNSVWATSPGFTIKPEEMTVIVKSFKDPSSVFAEGFEISGHKYVTIRADESSLYGRKGKENIIIAKTGKALLVAHAPATVQAGNAVNTVEQLADYLKKAGY